MHLFLICGFVVLFAVLATGQPGRPEWNSRPEQRGERVRGTLIALFFLAVLLFSGAVAAGFLVAQAHLAVRVAMGFVALLFVAMFFFAAIGQSGARRHFYVARRK
jgi:hypothetical protein